MDELGDTIGNVVVPIRLQCSKCNSDVDASQCVTEAVYGGAKGYIMNVLCINCRDTEWIDTVSWNG